ncbi:MAG: hypothetical protein CL814_08940 [Confluentimicrobium sp.]|uniref:Ferrochelatase n=1 Tax=Actibacterium naphthalenivorans TaxID=1614693 RepID=A0A840CHG5_9RHOB|nr:MULTISPECIES: hypothetical protein [Actibacterium]KGB83723.1 ferrochelatase [Rhodovulum sp. NI22]MDY6859353.1 hypothetical protein [Pseudomonadota bacterium]ALG88897.1 ferrochelatase [Actibacterium sp. EMB200-NS6]MBB4021587.1 hypothetical protein [Actibacterium naphthalenivorans]MBC57049.1 hypothetical protein [Actibacterium sp.]
MKKFALAAVVSMMATASFAGSMAEPVIEMEPEVIEQDTSSSAGGVLVPIMFLVMIAAAASN